MPEAPPPLAPALASLIGRASVPARLLREPGPGEAALALALAAAGRAPDHGALRPARFVGIAGEARHRFGEVLARSLAARDPAVVAERLDIERAKPLRAPLLVIAGAAIRHDHKGIPAWEQEAAAAAATMNFLNALDAQGFGAIWLSSPALGDAAVKDALGFAPTDTLLGMLYVGTPPADRPVPERRGERAAWRDWP